MSKTNFGLCAILILTAFFNAGCIIGFGDGRGSPSPTVGEELVDLQKARDSGAISGEEYDSQKKKLLAR